MVFNKRRFILNFTSCLWIYQSFGCTTTTVEPFLPPKPPQYTQVPHPEGRDLNDILELFNDKSAPKESDFSVHCDDDFRKLTSLTRSVFEQYEGVEELVRNDPIKYHWCFYGKIIQLESDLKKDIYLDEKQKLVLRTFQFLAPISRAFDQEFKDSRYRRWAVHQYQKWSEVVFYRRLQLTPKGTSELVEAENPFGLWRKSEQNTSVLQKYNLIDGPAVVSESSDPANAASPNHSSSYPSSIPSSIPSPEASVGPPLGPSSEPSPGSSSGPSSP